MRIHEILNEAKLAFSAAQLQQAVMNSEFGVIYLTMTGDGTIHLGDKWLARGDKTDPEYHADSSARRALKMSLLPAKKQLDFRNGSVGENLRPKVQQALRSLRDAGIIDSSWTIRTTRGASGYAIDMDDDGYRRSTWKEFPNPIDMQGLDALADKAIRLSPVTQHLVFYHGTSSLDWMTIQRVGLHPLGKGSNLQHGTESRAKHEGNAGVLYLAGSMEKALSYAKTRVEDWNRRKHGSPYIHNQDNDPVVLSVTIPDPARLVADDDAVNEIARSIARKIWQSKSSAEQQQIMANLSKAKGFVVKDPSVGQMLWRETDDGFAEIMARLPKQIFSRWRASLLRNNQVGYRGIIPPKFIRRVL